MMSKNKPAPSHAKAEAGNAAAKPLESGAGNMSDEDLAAIRGSVPAGAGPILDPVMRPEEFGLASTEVLGHHGTADPVELTLAARVFTLEQTVGDLTRGFESWSAAMNQRLSEAPRILSHEPPPVRAATRAEEDAYHRANFEMQQAGDRPYDGIQAWRDAGSPGLAK